MSIVFDEFYVKCQVNVHFLTVAFYFVIHIEYLMTKSIIAFHLFIVGLLKLLRSVQSFNKMYHKFITQSLSN